MSADHPQRSRRRSPPGSERTSPISVASLALLTTAQVAELLAVSDRTIKRLAAKRSLRCVRIGRSVRFDPSDVRRWVETRKE